jgi:hypothetical protein
MYTIVSAIKTKIVIEDPQDPHEQPQPEEEAE